VAVTVAGDERNSREQCNTAANTDEQAIHDTRGRLSASLGPYPALPEV